VLPLTDLGALARQSPDESPDLVLLNTAGSTTEDAVTLATIDATLAALPRTPVLLLAESERMRDIVAAVERGVRGYIPMSLELHLVVDVLRLVAAGGTFVPAAPVLACLEAAMAAKLPRLLAAAATSDLPATPLAGLTSRELAVFEHLRLRKANKMIARVLGMPEGTVKLQVRQIMKKLGAANRTQVALLGDQLMPPETSPDAA